MNAMMKGILAAGVLLLPHFLFSQHSYIIRPEFAAATIGDPYNLAPRMAKRSKVGLVLSGGGARGIAHIGVLKTLEKYNIPVDFIAGNSMGAVVGGLYAAGYSVAELESIVLHTNWTDILSFTEDTRRSELYVDQKQAQEHSFLLLRLDGLVPIIPSSLSGGQRFTNLLTTLCFQALYHPDPSFDDLKIPFRAVATDLISGKRLVMDRGSLAEALRATVTVPLLFTPLKRDVMELVDGGLVTNAPVDVARSAGCDFIISSNTTSGMRPSNQLNAPWETADQIMSIMMQSSNEKQFSMTDVVLTPNLRNHLSSEFRGLDSLIRLGEEEAEHHIDTIQALLSLHRNKLADSPPLNGAAKYAEKQSPVLRDAVVSFKGDELPENIKQTIMHRVAQREMTTQQIEEDLHQAFMTGDYADAYAEITKAASPPHVTYYVKKNPVLREVHFHGNTIIHDSVILETLRPTVNTSLNFFDARKSLESILKLYREKDYSLARIDSLQFNEQTGILRFTINEGIIRRVEVEGNHHTENYVIRREFPQEDGELFDIRKVQKGIVNINSTDLFEYVLLDIRYEGAQPVVVLKVEEKNTNNIRIGVHADNERSFQGLIDVRDANLYGSGAELGLTFAASSRNRLYRLEYHANRIFNTILTFNLHGSYRFDDVFVYDNAPTSTETRWERIEIGEYRQIKYGSTLAFGAQLERFGNITTELRLEDHEINPLGGRGDTPDRYKLVSLKLGTTIDTENRFPFPTSGVMLAVSFESAMPQLGSDVVFGKLSLTYENYLTVFQNHTFRPRVTLGVADATMPLAEQFSLGGLNSFFGLRENDRRGRQLFLVNTEYRFRFPFKIVFETFFKIRYDLGMISSIPEDIQLGKFHHGVGVEFALDTPIGPASFGVGKSFFFQRNLKNKPISSGPMLAYFSIGYGM